MRSRSRTLQALGLVGFAAGLIGFAVFGWNFGDKAASPVAVAVGLAAAALAVFSTVRNRE